MALYKAEFESNQDENKEEDWSRDGAVIYVEAPNMTTAIDAIGDLSSYGHFRSGPRLRKIELVTKNVVLRCEESTVQGRHWTGNAAFILPRKEEELG